MRVLPYLFSYKSFLILGVALGLCAGCGVRGALYAPVANAAQLPAKAGAAVLVGADGKTVQIAPQPTQMPSPAR